MFFVFVLCHLFDEWYDVSIYNSLSVCNLSSISQNRTPENMNVIVFSFLFFYHNVHPWQIYLSIEYQSFPFNTQKSCVCISKKIVEIKKSQQMKNMFCLCLFLNKENNAHCFQAKKSAIQWLQYPSPMTIWTHLWSIDLVVLWQIFMAAATLGEQIAHL